MMKKYLYFMLAGVAALASSCVKEPIQENNEEFRPGSVCVTASMDPETKATIAESDGAFRFSSGDAIKIFDGTAVKSGTTTSTESSGSFTMEDGFNAEGSGYAGFPAGLVSGITADGVIFTLPSSYVYSEVGNTDPDVAKVPVPMIGTYTGGSDVSLKQAGALIRFRVTNVAAGTLTFTFPTNVTGTLETAITTPSGTNDGILAANLTNAGKTITVTGVPETPSDSYIFITLPVPTGTATAGIKVFNNGSSRMSAPTGSSTGLSRASGYKLGVYLGDNQGAKGGFFTVNASGDQVYFSQGNLRAVCTSADEDPDTQETWTWQFAQYQYDYVGYAAANQNINGNGSVSEPGTVDLFGWSTDATYYGINNSTDGSNYNGSFRDWGALIGSGWRTLSTDEWEYIFEKRTNAASKYGYATIVHAFDLVDIRGLVVLPDSWSLPDGCEEFNAGGDQGWTTNRYDVEHWALMEAAGAVFLPAAGSRNGDNVDNLSGRGYYWSSSPYDSQKAMSFLFGIMTPGMTSDYIDSRNLGHSVRLVRDASNAPDQDPGMLSTPLTFEAKVAGAKVMFYQDPFIVNPPKLEYSTDGTIWNDYKADEYITITLDNIGDKVSFRAKLPNGAFYGDYGNVFTCDKDCYIYGNIMSLLSKDDFATMTSVPDNAFRGLFRDNAHIHNHPSKALVLPATVLGNYCYQEMFKNCDALTTAPALPATSLAQNCYCMMFYDCEALTTAPALPATSLAEWCYKSMFSGCTNLQTAPVLPATSLAKSCYSSMFQNCTSLVSAPDLPATTLAEECYNEMFAYCTQLSSASELPATTLAEGCYEEMFSNCTSLTTAPTLPAPTLVDYCYYLMFEECSNLNSVTCLATSIPDGVFCTGNWLDGVAASGTFIKAPSMTSWTSGVSGIPSGWTTSSFVNLANLTTDYTAQSGEALTGTLANNVKISITDGATVTLAGVTINGGDDWEKAWAGITCEGDATLVLADGTSNLVKHFYQQFAAISVPSGKTLTIQGSGSLTADARDEGGAGIGGNSSQNYGNIIINGAANVTAYGGGGCAGIGSGFTERHRPSVTGGDITINTSGTVKAYGGPNAAGIGSGYGARDNDNRCGNILISKGTVEATGGEDGAGIGTGRTGLGNSECGTISITDGVTSVTATRGGNYSNCIGAAINGKCGAISVDPSLTDSGEGSDTRIITKP